MRHEASPLIRNRFMKWLGTSRGGALDASLACDAGRHHPRLAWLCGDAHVDFVAERAVIVRLIQIASAP
jgi:hypothetical protein